jgi:hypothetical protein
LRDTQAHICDEAFYQEQILTHPSLPPAAPALPFPDFREEAAVISSALEGGDALIERRTTHAASRGASVEVVMLQNLMSQFGGGGGAMGRRSNAGGDEIGGGTLCGGADVIRADTLDMPCVGGRLSAGDAGAASTAASAASSLTEKLALQMALQRVSRGTSDFMNTGRGSVIGQGGLHTPAHQADCYGPDCIRYGGQDSCSQQRNYRTKPCRFFQQGVCKNGDHCNFLHVDTRGHHLPKSLLE